MTAIRPAAPVVRPADDALAAAAGVLNAADRVTILAGAGCAGAHDQLIALAGAVQAPVLHAFRGKDAVEYDNPYDVGMTGLIGFSSGYRAMEHCDALVMLGTDFPYRPFFPDGVPVIQVDVRGEQIGHRVPVDVPLVGTVRDTVDALLPLLTRKTDYGPPAPDDRALPAGPQTAGSSGRERPGPLAAAPAVRRGHHRPAGRRRRGVHRGRRLAVHLGGAVPADERPAADHRARSTTGRWPTRCRRPSGPRPATPAGR